MKTLGLKNLNLFIDSLYPTEVGVIMIIEKQDIFIEILNIIPKISTFLTENLKKNKKRTNHLGSANNFEEELKAMFKKMANKEFIELEKYDKYMQ